MNEQLIKKDTNLSEVRLQLLSKQLEEATNQFLAKISELEKLLPYVEE